EAFLGRAPAGVTAAIAFEQLVANNMNNLQDLVDDLEILLSELGTRLLDLSYKHQNGPREVSFVGSDQIRRKAKIIGEKDVERGGRKGSSMYARIPESSRVKVRIVSEVSYTKAN